MHVPGFNLKNTITIERIHSVHYFEFSNTYAFPGESHDFWELVYVDKGKITAYADDREILLESGSFLFHQPNQWHTIIARTDTAPNVSVITFTTHSPAVKAFNDLIISATAFEKQLIANIISESRQTFSTPLDDPYTNKLVAAADPPLGSQQLIKLYLSELLILLLRRVSEVHSPRVFMPSAGIFADITAYMQQNLSQKLTLSELAKTFGISTSSLKVLFRKHTNSGVTAYFINLKINRAKELLRGHICNVTQTAAQLGYENIYAFSAQFKKVTGMSPTEYLLSVKSHEKPTTERDRK